MPDGHLHEAERTVHAHELLMQAPIPETFSPEAPPAETEFRALARRGKNDWWRYLASFAVLLAAWQGVGTVPVLAVYAVAVTLQLRAALRTGVAPAALPDLYSVGVPPLLLFVLIMLTFIPWFVATLLVVRFLHGRPVRTLITPRRRISWGRMFQGAAAWLALGAAGSIVDAFLHPGAYRLTFAPVDFLIFLPVALLLTPIQTSTEELNFRGYLLQLLGLRIGRPWLLVFLTALLFTLPHLLNPEIYAGGHNLLDALLIIAGYFEVGAFLAIVTLKDNRLELALGAHAANNLSAVLLANYDNSALPGTPAVYTTSVLDPGFGLLSGLVIGALFYLIFFGPRPWHRTARAHARADL